ncbi:ATP-binding cassette domain-containing protein [Kitasatospora sp. NPDC057015]|uniref:ATP-binding cassette domain-containing protein n=1 Tax=Kitasatospora sp. NPDC057015 TaxID=3346001 RepID=UPI00363CAB63
MPPPPLLEARAVRKRYGRAEALRGADFTVFPGEIVSLIGDNGAGKSTLVKALSGAVQPDGGQVLIDGRPIRLTSPQHAQAAGIETVYQDLALAGSLGSAVNLHMGREVLRGGLLGRMGFLDRAAMRRRCIEQLASLGQKLNDVDAPISTLSGGQRQSVAICRAVTWAKRVVFMDEPTAALGVVQTRRVLDLIRRVRDAGVSVVLISHSMPQVLEVSDRIEVLRLGTRVARFRTGEATAEDLVAAMTGLLTHDTPEMT